MSQKLTRETVQHVAKLARLELNENEIAAFSIQLSAVLENFERISQIDTQGVAPLVTPTDITMLIREDVVNAQGETEKYLSNAPERAGQLYKVPPVVG